MKRIPHLIMLIGSFVLLLHGCSLPAQDPAPLETSTEPASAPEILSQRPLIFFAPLPPPTGSEDFMDLFSADAPWVDAAAHISIFKLYGGWVAHFPWEPLEASDEELATIVADLNRRGMAIAFESSPLVATDECGRGIEGFFGPEEGLAIARKLKALGADVRYMTFDEPYAFGHIYAGEQACQWTAEKIAGQVHAFITALREIYPDAIYGDIEPLWAGVDPQEYITWLDAYKDVTGENLPFLHIDPDYSRADWHLAAKQIEEAAHARGVEFGIIYFGDTFDSTDEAWLQKAFERARVYELEAGGAPDHVIFQSWHSHPDRVLPETEADTFTGFISRYFLPRTGLTFALDPVTTDGKHHFSGILTTETGETVPGVSIRLEATSLGAEGLITDYSMTGTVPAGAIRGNVGFRVNTECGCLAPSAFNLYEVIYTEGTDSLSRVPNYRFNNGWTGWSSWGNASIQLKTSDRGSGAMLQITATDSQDGALNSSSFVVTPGVEFSLTFTARVSPASIDSGYFAIFFLDSGTEISRQTIPIATGSVVLGFATTDDNGGYTFTLDADDEERLLLEVFFDGNEMLWPAYATLESTAP